MVVYPPNRVCSKKSSRLARGHQTLAAMSESLSLRGTMKGHADWVTAIATT